MISSADPYISSTTQEQFQLYRVQFETLMKDMMETQIEAMHTQMTATIQAHATTIRAQLKRMERLECQLGTCCT